MALATHIMHFGTFGMGLGSFESLGRAGASEVLSLGFQPLSLKQIALPFISIQNVSSRSAFGTKPEPPLELVQNLSSSLRFGTSVALPVEFQPLSLNNLCSRSGFASKHELLLEVCNVSCAPA